MINEKEGTYCDYPAVMRIIRRYLGPKERWPLMDLMMELYAACINDDINNDYTFSESSISRWLSGKYHVNRRIANYYIEQAHFDALVRDMEHNILPWMHDGAKAEEELCRLVQRDDCYSPATKAELIEGHPTSDDHARAVLMAGILRNVMLRPLRGRRRVSSV